MDNKAVYQKDGVVGAGQPVTGTETHYSKSILIDGKPASWHLQWTETVATLAGAFTCWYSNKPEPNEANDTDWVQDTAFPAPTVSGSGKAFISAAGVCGRKVRLKYINSTGSGTLLGWSHVGSGGGG